MIDQKLILKIYSITLTFLFGYFMLLSFKSIKSIEKIDEITVERINIVEPDGALKMVISNSKRQHPGMIDGIIIKERKRPPGIIFFNEEQDEVGGLAFSGNKNDGAGMVLSYDQYKNDQVMQMQYQRSRDGRQQYGINIWDRTENFTLPELMSVIDSLRNSNISSEKEAREVLLKMNDGKPMGAQRLFAGKNFNKQVGVFLKDEFGNNRITIFIDEKNNPKFQILDEKGKIVKEFVEK